MTCDHTGNTNSVDTLFAQTHILPMHRVGTLCLELILRACLLMYASSLRTHPARASCCA